MIGFFRRGGGFSKRSDNSTVIIINSTAQASLSATSSTDSTEFFIIPAGSLTLNNVCDIKLLGYFKNNTGSSQTVLFSVILGTGKLAESSTSAIATSAYSRAMSFNINLSLMNSANAQITTNISLSGTGNNGADVGDAYSAFLSKYDFASSNYQAPFNPAVANTIAIKITMPTASTDLTSGVKYKSIIITP